MKVTPLLGCPKKRRFQRLSYVCHGLRWGVHDHNLANVSRGLLERVFVVETSNGFATPPHPKSGVFCKLASFRNELLKHLGSCRRWTIDEFINSYHGAKKVLYEKAFASLTLRPLIRRDAQLRTFVKAEKLNLSKKPDPAPRVIQPRDMRYNCVIGPYIKPLEHSVYAAVGKVFGSPTIMKGFDAFQQGAIIAKKWSRFSRPVAIGLDASRFDQHVSGDALRWEHSIYNGVYRSDSLRKYLTWQVNNDGVAYTPDGKIRYSVVGRRMSGDMNTALGNCLLMCAMIHHMLEETGCEAELVNNGDDCVLILDELDVPRLPNMQAWFREFGFTMKVEDPVRQLEKIEFCQTQPVFDGVSWRMVRNPRVAFDKDGINLRPGNQTFQSWMKSVGECGLALTAGLPVMQEYYSYFMRVGATASTHMDACGMAYLRGGLPAESRNVSDQSRVSFWRAFGVPPHQQLCIEESLRQLQEGLREGMMKSEVASSRDYQF